MFVTGWLPVDGWMVGGWLALRLISYVAGWLAGYVAAGCAVLWLCGWLYWLSLAM